VLGREAAAGGAPGTVAQKGGGLASLHLGTKPADHRAQRGLPIAKLLGDILQATPFDEEGTERFVLAVLGRNRCKKETAAARVIHEPDLRKVDRFSPRCGEHQRRKGPEPLGAPGRPNDCRRCVSGATPPSSRRSKPLAQLPTWQDKPINPAVASHSIFWAKTAQAHPRLLQHFAPRKSALSIGSSRWGSNQLWPASQTLALAQWR